MLPSDESIPKRVLQELVRGEELLFLARLGKPMSPTIDFSNLTIRRIEDFEFNHWMKWFLSACFFAISIMLLLSAFIDSKTYNEHNTLFVCSFIICLIIGFVLNWQAYWVWLPKAKTPPMYFALTNDRFLQVTPDRIVTMALRSDITSVRRQGVNITVEFNGDSIRLELCEAQVPLANSDEQIA